jgi:hypothetical protein
VSVAAAPSTGDPQPGSRGRLALQVADAVDSVPGARRSSGAGTMIATQFRGGSVAGVRLSDEEISVHIVAERLDVVRLASAVSAAVTATLARSGERRRVTVNVDDLDLDVGGEIPSGDQVASGQAVSSQTSGAAAPAIAGRQR